MSVWVLAPVVVLLAVAMLTSAVRKVTHAPASVHLRDRLAVPPRTWTWIALAEGAAAVGLVAGLFAAVLGALAATGVLLLMLAAVGAHLRVGISGRDLLPPLVLGGLALTTVIGFAASV